MNVILFSSLFALVLVAVLVLVGNLLGASIPVLDSENKSPFECGFDPLSTIRSPFSTRFFLLAVVFLIFDIEIVLLLPALFLWNQNCNILLMGAIITFLLVLLLGVFHEWNEGSLDWANEI